MRFIVLPPIVTHAITFPKASSSRSPTNRGPVHVVTRRFKKSYKFSYHGELQRPLDASVLAPATSIQRHLVGEGG